MRTRDYEALIILKSAGTDQELAQSAVALEEPIRKLGGQVESSQALGRRRLAFRISRQVEGYYHLLRFRAPTDRLDELKRLYRLDETIVRFMITAPDDHAARPQAAASPTPREA